jgi:hypothetical protein
MNNDETIRKEVDKAVKSSLWIGAVTGLFIGVLSTILIELILKAI